MSGSNVLIDPLTRQVPQQNWEMIIKHAERFRRAADALATWSEVAKRCVDYFEDKQWAERDLHRLTDQRRPLLTINKIKPLVNLVLGYHLNNQTDVNYLPGNDGTGTAEVAAALTATAKQISQQNLLPYVDSEVFLDGILTGRGYYNGVLDFNENMFGRMKWEAADPFSTYPDPDADQYDLNSGSHITTSKWLSVDEVEFFYGVQAANLIRPLTNGMTFNQFPSTIYEGHEEISPWRKFGGDVDNPNSWRLYTDQFYNWVDTYRKTIRALDIQHYVRTFAWYFVDMETGDQRRVPDDWGPERVQKVLAWSQVNDEKITVVRKRVRRLRWTHMVGDIIVFDQWSPYDTFTIVPYFPYFRRGQTRGMVHSLLSPQDEVNVRRSARINIIGRTSNSGWKYEKGTLTPQMKRTLEKDGGAPGLMLEFDRKEGQLAEPTQIGPGQSPVSIEQLEKEAEDDLKQIAGINDSALGQVDQATVSGRAIQARQQQTVIGLEGFISNYHRTKELFGKKQLEVIQQHYTEQRIVRVTGPGSTPMETTLNQHSAAGIINNVTLGQYDVAIDDTSLSASFLDGQFNELIQMRGLGMPIPDSFIVDASSLGRKDELKAALAQAAQAQAAAGGAPGAPPGPGGPKPPGGGAPPQKHPTGPPQPQGPMGPHPAQPGQPHQP
jgi:hypothetical protein